ncbi:MAG TPA: hypothetical protein VHZ77_01755 [Gaiellaceae bacterium]|nr:hypothetical protein [Gaiellaceae bacterium]
MKPNPGGNEQLTALAGVLLVVFVAVEGATLLNLRALLTVHAFVGMFLLPIVALKMASTGWRMARYYLGSEEYVRRGPPPLPLRVVVAPVVVASTIVLFGTGVFLLAAHETHGTAVGLHKASFVVWLASTSIHVLTRLVRMSDALRARYPGLGLRLGLVAVTLVAGTAVAVATLPGADHLQDRMTAQVGFDQS